MKRIIHSVFVLVVINFTAFVAVADVRITQEKLETGDGYAFETIPLPVTNDAGASAAWKLLEGERDPNSARINALYNGKLPTSDDEPGSNFFFAAGSDGGKLLVDLGKVIPLKRISTFSRHVGDRAPQVYKVYGASGEEDAFTFDARQLQDPSSHGWRRIASVDTRQKGEAAGGQLGVSIVDSESLLGRVRYVLFLIEPTEKRDRFGLTFFSEIDIISADDADLKVASEVTSREWIRFQTDDARYQFQIDVAAAPDLKTWSEEELISLVQEWYPRIVEMLPSEGFQPAKKVRLQFRKDMPAAVPAAASGSTVNLNASWFRNHLRGEAKGCVIHELVHVVQSYGRAPRNSRQGGDIPDWLVEGIADYIRWFVYEPESGGAQMSQQQRTQARHDESYRVSANFIDWVARFHDKDIVRKLNAAARQGNYDESLWEVHSKRSLRDLEAGWKAVP